MDVKLLFHTPDPERAVAAAARLCYASVGISQLLETMTDKEVLRVLRIIIDSGHLSALEHASYSFAVEGFSRISSQQVMRHRLASYNQQSQRYVTLGEDELERIVPPSVQANPVALERFEASVDAAFAAYCDLVALGIPAEDARFLLPNATETKFVFTMNIRELLHFFDLRCCNRAQWEIRELAHRALALVEPTAPYIFLDAGAPCRRGSCPERHGMSCGNPYPKAPKRE